MMSPLAPPLTQTQDQLVLGPQGDGLRPVEAVQQHLQAQQLDGGEGGGHLDAGVETQAGRPGRTAEARGSCRGTEFQQCSDQLPSFYPLASRSRGRQKLNGNKTKSNVAVIVNTSKSQN